MTELEKFQAVNKTETLSELADVIRSFQDENGLIQGKSKSFDVETMAQYCERFYTLPSNVLTREFGIRQQGIYLVELLNY